jgi:hypothetical protein
MHEALDQMEVLESQWRKLVDEKDRLSIGWCDKAARDFDARYWTDFVTRMNALLPEMRQHVEELQHLVTTAEG